MSSLTYSSWIGKWRKDNDLLQTVHHHLPQFLQRVQQWRHNSR